MLQLPACTVTFLRLHADCGFLDACSRTCSCVGAVIRGWMPGPWIQKGAFDSLKYLDVSGAWFDGFQPAWYATSRLFGMPKLEVLKLANPTLYKGKRKLRTWLATAIRLASCPCLCTISHLCRTRPDARPPACQLADCQPTRCPLLRAGRVPDQIGFMPNLVHLNLSGGQWEGILPPSFSRRGVFPKMQELDMSFSFNLGGKRGAHVCGPTCIFPSACTETPHAS